MQDKLKEIAAHYDALVSQMEDPATYGDPDLLRRLTQEQKEIEPVVETYRACRKAEDAAAAAHRSRCLPAIPSSLPQLERPTFLATSTACLFAHASPLLFTIATSTIRGGAATPPQMRRRHHIQWRRRCKSSPTLLLPLVTGLLHLPSASCGSAHVQQ